MLRRAPTLSDGKAVDRLQESVRVNKPFKPPTLAKTNDRVQPQRKRKRASSTSATAAAKVQKTEDDGDDTTAPLPFLSEHDAQKILNVLEL